MRLLNVDTMRLESFPNAESTPPYAILSHRWEEEELRFEDLEQPYVGEVFELKKKLQELESQLGRLQGDFRRKYSLPSKASPSSEVKLNGDHPLTTIEDHHGPIPHLQPLRSSVIEAARRKGWAKVKGCCEEAQKFGLRYIWVDTCCIDQNSSSELSECVNSMFTWYRGAKLCIAFLSDVRRGLNSSTSEKVILEFNHSQWFRRGWTLQELIASKEVWFFDCDWKYLGLRSLLAERISSITHIDQNILMGSNLKTLQSFSVATRLSWAAGRKTTRPEDRAYSLLGLFGVNMPTVYGEGDEAAFFRLQNHIFQTYPDHSILAWQGTNTVSSDGDVELDLFAKSPGFFQTARSVQSTPYINVGLGQHRPQNVVGQTQPLYSMFNGLRIQLWMQFIRKDIYGKSRYQACLACRVQGLFLITRLVMNEPGNFKRLGYSFKRLPKASVDDKSWSFRDAYVLSPVRDLSPPEHGHVFRSEYLTIILKMEQLRQSGLQLGESSWSLEEKTENDERSLRIKSKSSATITDKTLFSDIVRVQPTEKSYGCLVFKVKLTGEIFGVMLLVIASQVKVKIVKNLTFVEFRRGYQIKSLQGEWPDLSLNVVSESLQSGKVIFVGSTLRSGSDGGAVLLRVGLQD